MTDEPMPTKGVNPNPPPRGMMALMRIVSIGLSLVGIALIPTGSASLGVALIALSLVLFSGVTGGVAKRDEPMPHNPVNPPPPPPLPMEPWLHLFSVIAGALGLYLIVSRSGFDIGAKLIAAGLLVNGISLALSAMRRTSRAVSA